MKFWWPVFLIAACSVAYQLGIKEISGGMHPLSALTVTYLSASLTSYMLYVLLAPKGENRKKEIFSWNPSALGLGAAIVGIELGVVYMYRAGWSVHSSFIVSNSLIVVALLVVGALVYGEKLKLRQLLSMVMALAGIACIVWGG
ncbi:EamA family transporter [uncultured Dialister sp.]|uniref:EamA family transporter n=1 Tax=uncultured Dialister sp. TaxID=278064 RepID=UPI0026DC6AB3|nr:EamA family transporter [uncultured Dialister sp.]